MKTFTEEVSLKNGVEVTIYLNVHEDENYTGVGVYLNDTCVYEKKVHGIYTSTNGLPKYGTDAMIDAVIAAYIGSSSEEAIDCKFID